MPHTVHIWEPAKAGNALYDLMRIFQHATGFQLLLLLV
jgi:hypothetical protein